jgi:nucleoid DNA-binding protein
MTKAELIAEVSARTNLPAQKVEGMVDAISEEIIDGMIFDSFVFLDGLGIFWAKREEEKRTRDPKTGEEYVHPAKRWPNFTPGELTDYAKNAGSRILTIQDLAENLSRKYGFDQSKSLDAIKTYVDVLIETMNRNENIAIADLGVFDSSRYPARSLKDPDTNEICRTEEKRVYNFSPARVAKERLIDT